jgi:putative hydrolase of the HAD superfamily
MDSEPLSSLPIAPENTEAIIFDFGGVLYDIDYNRPVRAFEALGIQGFAESFSKASQSDVFDQLDRGDISESNFLDFLAAQFGNTTPPSETQLRQAWNAILIGLPKYRIDLVHRLRQRFQTFLLSNTNSLHATEFELSIDRDYGLPWFRSAFNAIYYSHELRLRKPDVVIFEKVLALNGLNPSTTLFIDDSPQHIEGARQAGIHAYHFRVGKDDVATLFEAWI